MTDLDQQLADHLRRKAATAQPHYDLEAVRQELPILHPGETSDHSHRRGLRALAAIAAVAIVAVGVAKLVENTDQQVSTTPASSGDQESAPTAEGGSPAGLSGSDLPVMPGSAEGTRLLADCINNLGVAVEYQDDAALVGQPSITYDNQIVSDEDFETMKNQCTDDLVRSHQIYGLGSDAPTGPGIAVIPGSIEGTDLLLRCIADTGLEITLELGPSITYDNRVVSDEAFESAYDTCFDQLVQDGLLVPLGK